MSSHYRLGDRVVYTRDKYSTQPGPQAKNILADPKGERYQYQVDKFCIVSRILGNGLVEILSRQGKRHWIECEDRQLRHATWSEKVFQSALFPVLPRNLPQAVDASEADPTIP